MEQVQALHPYQLSNENYEAEKETLNTGYSADYLSWSICWDKLKQIHPTATHEMVMYEYDGKPYTGIMQPDGSVMVHCRIHYETEDGNTYTHNEYLAVRDKRNRALVSPDSANVENTYRRALAKGVSTLTGYGISLWMNEDLRELMTQETRMDGTTPAPGELSVEQNLKLDKLMRDPKTTDSDKDRIKKLKQDDYKINGKVITDVIAQSLIEDVEAGRQNNMKATKKSITELGKHIMENGTLTDDTKDKALEWLNVEGRTKGDLISLMAKLKIDREALNGV